MYCCKKKILVVQTFPSNATFTIFTPPGILFMVTLIIIVTIILCIIEVPFNILSKFKVCISILKPKNLKINEDRLIIQTNFALSVQ